MSTCPDEPCTLQELVDGSTITINDTRFTGWQLSFVIPFGTLPDPSLIEVIPIDDPVNPGLRLQANDQLSLAGQFSGATVGILFNYVAEALSSQPTIRGHSIELIEFSGDRGNLLGLSTVCAGAGACGSDEVLHDAAVNATFAADGIFGVQFDSAAFAPHTQVFVQNTLIAQVIGGPLFGSAVLGSFEQRLSLVPEPSAFAILGVGILSMLSFAGYRHRRGNGGSTNSGAAAAMPC